MIAEYPFDAARFVETQLLFPEEIEDDGWVLFHGTSSVYEERIDSEGLRPGQGAVTRAHLERLGSIYEGLGWCGWDSGGYAVLRGFSMSFDEAVVGGRLFLAESSKRAALYASSDFRGGEKVRAVRKSLSELDSILNDRERQAQFVAEHERRIASGAPPWPMPPVLKPISTYEVLPWLRARVEALKDAREVVGAVGHHDYGIVYAVRVPDGGPLHGLHYNPSMGIVAERDLPAAWLLGKVRLPDHFQVDPGEEDHRRSWPARQDRVLLALGGPGTWRHRARNGVRSVSFEAGVLKVLTDFKEGTYLPSDVAGPMTGLEFSVSVAGQPTGRFWTMRADGEVSVIELRMGGVRIPTWSSLQISFDIPRRVLDLSDPGSR